QPPDSDGGTGPNGNAIDDAGATGDDAAPNDGTQDAGDAGPPAIPPVLVTLAANQFGRTGADVKLSLHGMDVNQTSFGLRVSLFDASGNPVLGFRDWTGAPSAASRIVLFDDESAAGEADFTRTVTLPQLKRSFASVARIEGAIIDSTGIDS